MGGDDLESDDEYLNVTISEPNSQGYIVENPNDSGGENDQESSNGKSTINDEHSMSKRTSKKRKATSQNVGSATNTNKPIHKVKLLLETGRHIVNQRSEVQSAFLWSCYVHFSREENEKDLNPQNSIFESSFFIPWLPSSKPTPPNLSSLGYFLKSNLSSLKQLKKWKKPRSPMVLIVCLSARRATTILKSLSSLNVRTAKLFSKHFDLQQQILMLRENSYGIGVGTPNRLLKLSTSNENNPALSLEDTEIIILDSHSDNKRFTVCTLNDTAPDLMSFLKKSVVPQLHRNKNPIKLAFV